MLKLMENVMNKIIAIMVMVLCISMVIGLSICAETSMETNNKTVDGKISTNVKTQKPSRNIDFVYISEPIPTIPTELDRKIEWTLNNLDNWDGWSLSGYSKFKLTENFDPYRIKIGVINPDITYTYLNRNEEEIFRSTRDIHDNHRGIVVGIAFTRLF